VLIPRTIAIEIPVARLRQFLALPTEVERRSAARALLRIRMQEQTRGQMRMQMRMQMQMRRQMPTSVSGVLMPTPAGVV
jgi:hypothetical protein